MSKDGERAGLSAKRPWGVFVAVALAGLSGAGGVILAAVAAHLVADQRLTIAAGFLILHACAVLALSGLSVSLPHGRVWLWAAFVFLFGSLLFAGDLALRAIAGRPLFPMAAPIGGTLLIFGWFWVGVAALVQLWRSEGPQGPESFEQGTVKS